MQDLPRVRLNSDKFKEAFEDLRGELAPVGWVLARRSAFNKKESVEEEISILCTNSEKELNP